MILFLSGSAVSTAYISVKTLQRLLTDETQTSPKNRKNPCH